MGRRAMIRSTITKPTAARTRASSSQGAMSPPPRDPGSDQLLSEPPYSSLHVSVVSRASTAGVCQASTTSPAAASMMTAVAPVRWRGRSSVARRSLRRAMRTGPVCRGHVYCATAYTRTKPRTGPRVIPSASYHGRGGSGALMMLRTMSPSVSVVTGKAPLLKTSVCSGVARAASPEVPEAKRAISAAIIAWVRTARTGSPRPGLHAVPRKTTYKRPRPTASPMPVDPAHPMALPMCSPFDCVSMYQPIDTFKRVWTKGVWTTGRPRRPTARTRGSAAGSPARTSIPGRSGSPRP
ncbi:hypothetical protein ACFFX0_11455 [Citricoccus parietis]|uniref:Uncharacterized protein n=1 Tax=Citricoccus parietis TaxID=592307 RepID=A0ABV5FYN6_9MICC